MTVASRKRRFLAVYLDLVFFGIPYVWITAAVGEVLPAVGLPDVRVSLVAFAIFELVLLRFIRFSPGYWVLGIHFVKLPGVDSPVPVVDPRIKARERWYTMLLGVLFINSGAKGLIRWVQYHTPMPVFGRELGAVGSIGASMLLGAIALGIGIAVLRTDRKAVPAGLAYALVSLVFAVTGSAYWDDWAAAEVVNRRTFQGRPVREDEIAFMQAVFYPGILVASAVWAAAFLVLGRVWRARPQPSPDS